jgi:acetolactate decarboxylase
MDRKSTVDVSLPADLVERLMAGGAPKEGMSASEAVEEAIREGLDEREADNAIFISAPVNAMMKGFYEEDTFIGDLKRHGDFGLGTFNSLDGEMLMLDGVVYQLKSDGYTYVVEDGVQTPFACVTFFRPYSHEVIDREMDYRSFNAFIDTLIPSRNMFYAIRMEGKFREMKVWSVRRQANYKPILEPEEAQAAFEYTDVEGTLAGFFAPTFMKSLIMPGFHLHFVTADRKHGGHLHECIVDRADVGIQHMDKLKMNLPITLDYMTADLRR